MTQTVTLRTRTTDSVNEINEVIPAYTDAATVMYLEPTAGIEEETDRNTPIQKWRGFGRADVVWDSTQQVVWNGHTLNVTAVRPIPNARLGTTSHYELDLQEIT